MIDPKHDVSITRQAELVGISRAAVYYVPRPVSEADLVLMRRIDELHLEYPFAGARTLRDLLRPEGFEAGRKHIALDHWTIQATIWAPPGEFVVDTPSAMAVDLGCMYTLHVDESGGGLLRTTLGWVGFRSNGRESFIPAGAAAVTYPRTGPGLPYFENATSTFRAATSEFDSAADPSAQRSIALQAILGEARPHDALTLWHLLPRVNETDRPTVYDRLAALVPPPPGVTRESVLRLDRTALDSWWNALDLGDVSLWRTFEQSWTNAGAGPKAGNIGQPK